jgi:hypothetical protein
MMNQVKIVKTQEMQWKRNQIANIKTVKINPKINFTIKDFHLLIRFKIFIRRNQIKIRLMLNLGELI